jgi:hypothetical protein
MVVPPKNCANCEVIPALTAIEGRIAIIARKMDPGRVILDIILSKKSTVFLPG